MESDTEKDLNSYEISILEDRIKNVILKIRNGRSRPCYQSILNHVNRGDLKVEMESLKTVLNNLVERSVIKIKGDNGKESFYVVDSEDTSFTTEEIDVNDHIEYETSSTSAEHLIQEKFHETLINMIKVEVKKELSNNMESGINAKTTREKTSNEFLIESLKSEITFLRGEVNCKNEIIKLLLNDCDVGNKYVKDVAKDSNNKKSTKPMEMNTGKHNNLTLQNNLTEEGANNFTRVTRKRAKKRNITIIGDSIIKDVKPFKLNKILPSNTKMYVKSFGGATSDDMTSYVKPSLKFKPDLWILHTGTNDLRSGAKPCEIANKIIQLAVSLKTDENEVAVSAIVERGDHFNDKGMEVNGILKLKAIENNVEFIDHDDVKKKTHLNGSAIHLNSNGIDVISRNFVNFINL